MERKTKSSLPKKPKPEQISSVPRKNTSKNLSSDRIILFNHTYHPASSYHPLSFYYLSISSLILSQTNINFIRIPPWPRQESSSSSTKDHRKRPIAVFGPSHNILMVSVGKVLIISSNVTPSSTLMATNIGMKRRQSSSIPVNRSRTSWRRDSLTAPCQFLFKEPMAIPTDSTSKKVGWVNSSTKTGG